MSKRIFHIGMTVLWLVGLLGAPAAAQTSLHIGNGMNVVVNNEMHLRLGGNWMQDGGFTAGSGTVVFTGSVRDTIRGSATPQFYRLRTDKSAEKVVLLTDVQITDSLVTASGNLDLNGHVVTLDAGAHLRETASGRVMGESGYLSVTVDLNAPDGVNPANLGAEITSAQNLGSTEIRRGHTAQSGNGHFGIQRYYDIIPTNNSNLNATLVFHYRDEELNGHTEANLVLYRSEDGGSTWTQEGGTVNTDANIITLSGISSFSRWTAAATDQSLPVTLSLFTAEVQGLTVVLNWRTESETENAFFLLERSTDSLNYRLIARLPGQGNSNQPTDYTFTDEQVQPGTQYFYRLSDQSLEGKVTVLRILRIHTPEIPQRFRLFPNYPNPFNPTTTIAFDVPLLRGKMGTRRVKLEIFDLTGRRVKTLVDEELLPGHYTVQWDGTNLHHQPVTSGMYFYRLSTEGFIRVRRMMLLK